MCTILTTSLTRLAPTRRVGDPPGLVMQDKQTWLARTAPPWQNAM